ncbi:MAG: DMT family transporter [Ignavibacteria bacterium]|nr:DMT family transporter [Ignavibacteria bacterium]
MTVRSKAELALFGTTAIWGGTFVAMKIGLSDMSSMLQIALRFMVGALFFLVFFWRNIFPIPSSAILKGGILGLFLFLAFAAQTIGLNYTTASKSAFITGMMVIFVPLLQVIIERRAPKLGNILGVLVVLLGLWFLTSPTGAEFNVGDALTLVCAVLFGVYIVYLDVVSKETTTMQLTFLQVATCAVLGWTSIVLFEPPSFAFSEGSIVSLLYLTFLATLLATYVQTRFQKDTTPTRAVIIFTIEPVIASVAAYLILDEVLGTLGIVGGGLIILGVLVSEFSDAVPGLNMSFDPTQKDPASTS